MLGLKPRLVPSEFKVVHNNYETSAFCLTLITGPGVFFDPGGT